MGSVNTSETFVWLKRRRPYLGDGGSEAESISRMEKLFCMGTTKHSTWATRVHNTKEQWEKGLNGKRDIDKEYRWKKFQAQKYAAWQHGRETFNDSLAYRHSNGSQGDAYEMRG